MKAVNDIRNEAQNKQITLDEYDDLAFKQVSPRTLFSKLNVAIKKVQPVNQG